MYYYNNWEQDVCPCKHHTADVFWQRKSDSHIRPCIRAYVLDTYPWLDVQLKLKTTVDASNAEALSLYKQATEDIADKINALVSSSNNILVITIYREKTWLHHRKHNFVTKQLKDCCFFCQLFISLVLVAII